jgi:hypothetical protein
MLYYKFSPLDRDFRSQKMPRILIEPGFASCVGRESLRIKSGPDGTTSTEFRGRRVSPAKGHAMAKNTICLLLRRNLS